MFVSWFENIEEISSKLTSGNVSHQGALSSSRSIVKLRRNSYGKNLVSRR